MNTTHLPSRKETAPLPPRSLRAVRVVFFLNGMLFATWASRIPAVQSAQALSASALGLALLTMAFGALVAMPLTGLAVGRFGSRGATITAAISFCLMLPALAYAPGPIGFHLVLLGFGAAHGALDVAMNAQAVAVEARTPHPLMSSFHALWSTGGLAGALIGGLAASAGLSIRPHFLLVGLPLIGVAWWASRHLLEAVPQAAEGRSHRPALDLGTWRPLILLGVIALCIMLGEGAMADWSAVYLRQELGTTEGVGAIGYAAFSIAMAVGRYWGDSVTRRFGAVALVRGGSLLAAAGLAVALVSGTPYLVLLGYAAAGLGFAIIIPLVVSAAGRVPGVSEGLAVAVVTTLGYFGFLIGPPAIGFLSAAFGLRVAFAMDVLAILLAAGLASAVGPAPRLQVERPRQRVPSPSPSGIPA
ncbi:MAG: MFS transporter [Verrucomicrobiae bacterium]|nr:MFS transporter [Verrucomicrobiae bacterium]